MAHVICRGGRPHRHCGHCDQEARAGERPGGEIKRLEEEGDAIYHEAVGALFAGTPDPIEVIRWKEVYETLEIAIDQCMGVATALQSISIKNA